MRAGRRGGSEARARAHRLALIPHLAPARPASDLSAPLLLHPCPSARLQMFQLAVTIGILAAQVCGVVA